MRLALVRGRAIEGYPHQKTSSLGSDPATCLPVKSHAGENIMGLEPVLAKYWTRELGK